MNEQTPGHLFGPPAPHIVFQYGERILAEVRGHPMNITQARQAAERSISMLELPTSRGPTLAMLRHSRSVLVCGPVSMDVSDYLDAHRDQHMLNFCLMLKGYSRTPINSTPKYVLTVVLSQDGLYAIGLIKTKGPKQVLGKITFPGGQVKPGESAADAASRELYEETGVHLDAARFVNIANSETMAVFAARSDDVLRAFTREDEEVVILAIERHLAYVEKNPDPYVTEFKIFLQAAADAV